MLGHAAGLVTCLTLMKDAKENPQLQELGTFILLFGVGLIVAVFSVMAWTVGAASFVVLPKGRGWFRWPGWASRSSTPSASPTSIRKNSTEEERLNIPLPRMVLDDGTSRPLLHSLYGGCDRHRYFLVSRPVSVALAAISTG